MIELTNVTFNYSTQGESGVLPALQNVNLQIHEGETIAIIGHNGSGKSTLTKLIAGTLHPHPYRGSVLVDGLRSDANAEAIWTIRQRVGMVFQNPDDQLIASTVIDDIAFGPENLALPRQEIEQRVQAAIKLLRLEQYAQMSINELSLSLKQRVAIAGVLAMQPRYLILDEPTAMISGQTARQLLHTVQQLSREHGITIMHITHFMHEITSFDRVLVMDEGRILMDGTPATIFSRVEELQAVGLDVPMITHLGRRLIAHGWQQIPEVVLSPAQLLNTPALSTERNNSDHTIIGAIENQTSQSDLGTLTSEVTPLPSEGIPIFALNDLFYTYQHNTPFAQEALRGLSLTIQQGQLTALVGPTGAGKSTLIDLMAGLLKQHAGVFHFEGKNTMEPPFKLEQIRARVGVVFQSPEAQIFEETVGKDVSFGPRQKKVPLAESRRLVQEALEAVGLPYEEFRLRYTYALSGGQKRRVAIAGVLALQPSVLIFDEPMAGLDPRGRNELFKLIVTLKQRKDLTIIYATSSLKDVVELADIIYVLESGRVAFSGIPRAILARANTLQALDIALPEAAQIALALRTHIAGLRTDVLDLEELEETLQHAIQQSE